MQEQENEKIEQLIREQLSEGIHKKVTKKPRRRKVAKEMIWAALLLAVVTLITLFRMESEPNSSVTFFDKWKNFILIGLVVINYLITWMLLSKKSPIQDVAVKRAVATVVALLTVVGIGSFAVMATLTPTEEAAVAGSGGNGNPAKAGGETGGKGMDVLSGKCLGCHTFKGKGGTMGPDLTDIKNRKDRESIRNYIKNPAGAMPKLNLPDEDLESVVALLTEGAKDGQAKPQGTAPDKNEPPKTAAGPVDKGKELYDKHGCAGCHSINGNGGSFGPDLTKVGSNRTKEWIAEFLKKPSPKMAITPLNPEEIQVLSEYLSTFK